MRADPIEHDAPGPEEHDAVHHRVQRSDKPTAVATRVTLTRTNGHIEHKTHVKVGDGTKQIVEGPLPESNYWETLLVALQTLYVIDRLPRPVWVEAA